MIHKTAIVDSKAKISSNVSIGAYSVIGSGVEIGENTKIDSHVSIIGNTKIGKNNKVYPFASIGNDPQDFCNEYHYRNFQRNQRLIDFDYIPDDIQTDIYKEYEKATVTSRSKILPYMIQHDLKELIGKIEEF